MHVENVVIDTVDPRLVGRFWEAALGCEPLTDDENGYETRLSIEGGPVLDLCFQPVGTLPTDGPRLHVDLLGGSAQREVIERLIAIGARHLDIGQHDVPWVVLGDPEGNAFCVMEERPEYVGTGPIAAIPFEGADPDRDAAFWAWLTGWVDAPGVAPRTLRHPSMRGPLLEFCPERSPKSEAKNRWHLDVRLEAGEDPDEVAAAIAERGGRAFDLGVGPLPWRTYRDPSGNEFCVLAASVEPTDQ
jgi:hypothetical protein